MKFLGELAVSDWSLCLMRKVLFLRQGSGLLMNIHLTNPLHILVDYYIY